MLNPMTDSDLPFVAHLFCERLPESPLTRMGEEFVGEFLAGFTACPLGLVDVARDGERVQGFALAAIDAAGMFAWLRHDWWERLVPYRRQAETDLTRGFWELLDGGKHYHPDQLADVAAELMFVAVHWDRQGTKLATGLVRQMLAELHEAGVDRVKVFVGLHNSPPQNMLWALGFEQKGSFVQNDRELVGYVHTNLAEALGLS